MYCVAINVGGRESKRFRRLAVNNFYVGQKVVCVDTTTQFGSVPLDPGDLHEIKVGSVYTIRWIGEHDDPDVSPLYLGIRLEEVERSRTYPELDPNHWDVPFDHRRFRPLIQTDISVFTAMLNPTQEKKRKSSNEFA
jgi:hypothetical protein